MIKTKLTKLLGIEHPVVCAPASPVVGAKLASAVTAAGGLGLLGGGYGDAAFLDYELPKLAEAGGLWGIGCVMFSFDRKPGLWLKVIHYRPPVVALTFGDEQQVRRYAAEALAVGSKVLIQVHDLAQAVVGLDAGATALIAQGAEAGGHHKTRATLPLIPAVVDLVGGLVPVIAAGGIADGRGLAAALMLGADGVMMGTRFAATQESLASAGFKRTLVSASCADVGDTPVFDAVRGIAWSPEYSGRAVLNDFHHRWIGRMEELRSRRAEVEQAWLAAVAKDDTKQRAIFAGEVIDLVHDLPAAGDVVRTVVHEAVSALHRVRVAVSPASEN